jgi:hypothetical protein
MAETSDRTPRNLLLRDGYWLRLPFLGHERADGLGLLSSPVRVAQQLEVGAFEQVLAPRGRGLGGMPCGHGRR